MTLIYIIIPSNQPIPLKPAQESATQAPHPGPQAKANKPHTKP